MYTKSTDDRINRHVAWVNVYLVAVAVYVVASAALFVWAVTR